jgi:hypothetical protein
MVVNSHVGMGTATLNRSGLGADHIVLTVGADTEMGMLELQGTRTSDADLGRISFLNAGTRRAEIVAARIDADNSTKLYFQTSNAGSLGTRLTIGKDGAATFNSSVSTGGDIILPSTGKLYSSGDTDSFLQFNQPNTLRAIIGDSTRMIIEPNTTVFNEDSADVDFRVESNDNTHMLFVDGGNNRVGVAQSAPQEPLHATGRILSTTTYGGSTQRIGTSIGQNGNTRADIDFRRWTGASTNHGVGMIEVADTGIMRFYVDSVTSNTPATTERISLDPTGAFTTTPAAGGHAVFNEGGADADFRVESDGNENMLFVDGGSNKVGIGRDPQDNGSTLQVAADATASTDLQLALRGLSNENKKLLLGFDTTANIGSISSVESGVTHHPLHLQGSEFVWNESGSDHDFRVESDGNANAFFLDASNGNIGMGGTSNVPLNIYRNGAGNTELLRLTNDNTNNHNFYVFVNDDDNMVRFGSTGDNGGNFAFLETTNTNDSIVLYTAGGATFNELGNDSDFRVESDTNTHALFVDAGNSYVNLNSSATPDASVAGFMFTADQLYTSAGAATTLNYQVRFYNGNGLVGAITTDGSATAYLTSSDQRLKENIADADDAGSKIDAIQVRKYDWKADGSHQDYGMVAQELQLVAPEAVSGDADSEEMMGVDYSKLVPMLIKEIQSLRARVADLES